MGPKQAVDLGGVHPQQQLGIRRPVRAAVGGDAGYPLVNPAYDLDGALRLLGRTERGGGDEGAGPLQTTEGVSPKVGVLGNPGHGQRVHGLQQQRPQPSDQTAGPVMDPPGGAVRPEETWILTGRITESEFSAAGSPPSMVRTAAPTAPRSGSASVARFVCITQR